MSDSYLEKLSTEDLVELKKNNLQGVSTEGLKLLRDNNYEMGDNKKKQGITKAVAIGAGGVAVDQARRFITAPGRAVKPIDKELSGIQQKLGVQGTSPEDLPALIKSRAEEMSVKYRINKDQFQSKLYDVKTRIGQHAQEFDNMILNQSADDVAKTIQGNFSEFARSSYKAYGDGLASVERQLSSRNISFNSEQLIDEVINPAIASAKASGTTGDQLASLERYKNSFMSGKKQNMSYSQIKGNMNKLSGELPPNAQYKLTESWGKFLEKNAPPEVRNTISKLNSQYKPLAEARNAILKTFDRKTGTFDRVKLNKWLSDYAKKTADSSKGELLKFLKEGNELVKPIKDLDKTVSSFEKAMKGRKPIIKALDKLDKIKVNKLAKIKSDAEAAKLNFLKWSNKSKELLSKKDVIKNRYGFRGKFIKGAGRAARFAASGGRLLAMYPMAKSIIQGISDPAKFRSDMLGSAIPVPDKGTKDRAVLENIINKKEIPEGMNITPEEEFDILVKYGLGT